MVPAKLLSLVALGSFLVFGCTDADQVNAAFRQGRISWYTWDPSVSSGLKPLASLEQETQISWLPRPWAVRATAVAQTNQSGLAAVSHLGLVVFDDSAAELKAWRPDAKIPWVAYRTLAASFDGTRAYVVVTQDPPVQAPSVGLLWWSPGQTRAVVYPLASQVASPSRQVIQAAFSGNHLSLAWTGQEQNLVTSVLNLDTGEEASDSFQDSPPPSMNNPAVRALADHLGSVQHLHGGTGVGPTLAWTNDGWTSVIGKNGRPRIYRLPDLGPDGQYTNVLSLSQGWVFTWEVGAKAYVGASGVVYIPRGILAP